MDFDFVGGASAKKYTPLKQDQLQSFSVPDDFESRTEAERKKYVEDLLESKFFPVIQHIEEPLRSTGKHDQVVIKDGLRQCKNGKLPKLEPWHDVWLAFFILSKGYSNKNDVTASDYDITSQFYCEEVCGATQHWDTLGENLEKSGAAVDELISKVTGDDIVNISFGGPVTAAILDFMKFLVANYTSFKALVAASRLS
eukprot:TRINITY_DN7558_c1_g1_i2.p1 TRINITY_DN7558_c1_g1~~TRINITY_DN7558_c1_g1_i2.p1  ORF type:complete len:198 (+),score=40.27 TRINITY_DN7558_c1_g1_i2:871-1464(+)